MELERCGFLHFEVYLVSDNFLLLFFSIREFCAPSVDFFQFSKNIFFTFFLKRIRCSKYKQQKNFEGTNKLPNAKFAILFLQTCTCEAFLINTKILRFSKKLENSYKKNPTNQNILFPRFTSLFQISKL